MKLIKVLLFLTAFSSFAQIRFEQGYFVDNAGTRQDVLIRYIEWKDSPTSFDYKMTEGTETLQRNIINTSEFSVGGNTYKRFDVKIDRSSSIVNNMSDTPVINWKSEALFLKRLVDGKLALYQYEDSNIVKYFYSDDSHSSATQLMYREYNKDGQIIVNNTYRQELYNLMKDKYTDAEYFKNIKYKEKELTLIFENYNGVQSDDNKSRKYSNGDFNLKVTLGGTLSSMHVQTFPNGTYSNDFDAKVNLRAGLQTEYVLPFNRNKWSILADPNYQKYTNETTSGPHTWTIQYHRIDLPFLIRHYFYLNNDLSIFLNGGYLASLSIGNSYIRTNGGESYKISKNNMWTLGAGVNYNRLSLEGRYIPKHHLANTGLWLTDFTSVQLILAYKLL